MTGGTSRVTATAALLAVAAVATGGSASGTTGAAGTLGLPDGAAWITATATLAAVPCLELTLAGVVGAVGRGQAVFAEIEGVGHAGIFFAQHAPVAVRAAAAAGSLLVEASLGYAPDGTGKAYDRTFGFCRQEGTFEGSYAIRAYHTNGIVADASRLAGSAGSLTLAPDASGAGVVLLNSRDFRGTAIEIGGPRVAGAALGQSALVNAEVQVQTVGAAFGSFLVFEAAESWRLAGPGGIFAWKGDVGLGGNVDPAAFGGPAGTWTARIDRSVSKATPGQVFLVLAGDGVTPAG